MVPSINTTNELRQIEGMYFQTFTDY